MQRAVREHFNFNWDKYGSFRLPTPRATSHVFGQIGVGTIEIPQPSRVCAMHG